MSVWRKLSHPGPESICLTEQEGLTSLKTLCFCYLLSFWIYLWISMLFLCTLKLNLFLRFLPSFLPLRPTPSPPQGTPRRHPSGGRALSVFIRRFVHVHISASLCVLVRPACPILLIFEASIWVSTSSFGMLACSLNFKVVKLPVELMEI